MVAGLNRSVAHSITDPKLGDRCKNIFGSALIVAKHGGLFITHMRNEADYIWSALDEVFEVARASDAHLHISHLKISGRNNWGQAQRLIQRTALWRKLSI